MMGRGSMGIFSGNRTRQGLRFGYCHDSPSVVFEESFALGQYDTPRYIQSIYSTLNTYGNLQNVPHCSLISFKSFLFFPGISKPRRCLKPCPRCRDRGFVLPSALGFGPASTGSYLSALGDRNRSLCIGRRETPSDPKVILWSAWMCCSLAWRRNLWGSAESHVSLSYHSEWSPGCLG
jgi:hypothetical protein